MDVFEPETLGALDSGVRNTGRPKRKEVEKHSYVHLSEDHSDPELMAHRHIHMSRSPSTIDHIDKVKFSSTLNVQGCMCGIIFVIEASCESYICSRVWWQLD